MLIESKLQKIGGSLFVSIPKKIIDKLKAKQGDSIIVDILRVKELHKKYRCKKCQHKFSGNDIEAYCTSCGCEDLEEIFIENE